MDEEQPKHQEELGLWKKEAKAAQDRVCRILLQLFDICLKLCPLPCK